MLLESSRARVRPSRFLVGESSHILVLDREINSLIAGRYCGADGATIRTTLRFDCRPYFAELHSSCGNDSFRANGSLLHCNLFALPWVDSSRLIRAFEKGGNRICNMTERYSI